MSLPRALATHAAVALALCGCELTEITVASPEDIIVAEVILRTDREVLTAYLHRTTGTQNTARVPDAVLTVHDEATGKLLHYEPAADSICLRGRRSLESAAVGTCYASGYAVGFVRSGADYALRIQVGARVMTGRLHVPGDFRLLRPEQVQPCSLPPGQSLELVWTSARDAWVYVAEGFFVNLRQALRETGVNVTGTDPVELTGLSVSGADTTLVFPSELGLFDRFDPDLHPIVLAIQDGLPSGVNVALWIAAGDRNYVNWVRGGVFNPSGQVRVPSIQGDGTGVFGSLVVVHQSINVRDEPSPFPCN